MKLSGRLLLGLAACAALAVARPRNGDPVKETGKQIASALAKGDLDALRAGFERAEELRPNYHDQQFTAVAKAIGKGVTHKDPQIALAAMEMLGKLKVRGSGRLLAPLISPPPQVKEKRLPLHQAALRAAGSIHDPETLRTIEKVVLHTNPDLAVVAAEALAGYKVLDEKPKTALLKRLVSALAKLEKKAAYAKDEKSRGAAEGVGGAVAAALSTLTGKEGLVKSAEWTAWLKAQRKQAKA
ncbi:MAG: hypothetical protein ACYTEZ_19355 [Planctomycetota bacterium]|jgi:hypothetical protein